LTPPSRLRSGAALAVGALLLAGCGTGGIDKSTNVSGGKDLFVAKCGTCHTLADAGTTGTIGPNLDDAFAGSRAQGFSESTIRQIVRDQIHFPSPARGAARFPVMPPNLVRGADAEAVAAYVASVAGTGAAPSPPAPPAPPSPPAPTTTATTAPPPAPPSGGDAAKGKSLYTSLGCTSCHSLDGSSGIGPTFKGLYGSKVKLTNGKTVTADDAYLLASIEDPDAEIVQGFQPGIMSGVIKPHQVALADARNLVAFIKSLK
jgi:cytochrome c2